VCVNIVYILSLVSVVLISCRNTNVFCVCFLMQKLRNHFYKIRIVGAVGVRIKWDNFLLCLKFCWSVG
jgi:hypothetical protein